MRFNSNLNAFSISTYAKKHAVRTKIKKMLINFGSSFFLDKWKQTFEMKIMITINNDTTIIITDTMNRQ